MKGMGTQCSNTATRLRHQCAALFGVSESDMLRPDLRREKFRARIGWVENGRGSGSYSSVDVEILHNNYSGSYEIKTAFLNPILMWVSYHLYTATNCNNRLTNFISGLRRHYPRSNFSQGVNEWDPVQPQNRDNG